MLPALPDAWATGHADGLRARGGFEVDQQWRDGVLVTATIRASEDGLCRVRYAKPLLVMLEGQAVDTERPEPGVEVFQAKAGQAYEVELAR